VLADPDIGLRTLAILAGILFIVRGVFEIALAWELHRIHRVCSGRTASSAARAGIFSAHRTAGIAAE
jgi:hypothetical protein